MTENRWWARSFTPLTAGTDHTHFLRFLLAHDISAFKAYLVEDKT